MTLQAVTMITSVMIEIISVNFRRLLDAPMIVELPNDLKSSPGNDSRFTQSGDIVTMSNQAQSARSSLNGLIRISDTFHCHS